MAVIDFDEIKNNTIVELGKQLMVSAKTAPKGRGVDLLKIVLVTDKNIELLSNEMKRISISTNQAFFERDGKNIEKAEAIILFGTPIKPLGLKLCGMCGFENCAENEEHPENPCVFNLIDMGIAMGSVVSKAGELGIDNRIMYTIGQAAKNLNLMPDCKIIMGIPLAAEAKNPFFDRQ